jgi:superfamily II DNA/RNA helicase
MNRFNNGQNRNRFRSFGGGSRTRSSSRNPNKEQIQSSLYIKKAVVTEDKEIYKHSFVFQDLNVDPILKRNIATKAFTIPTPIQDQAIEPAMKGKDLLGLANTGTGKTAAFLIPLIQKVITHPMEQVLIITPTRELAEQIDNDFRDLARGLRIYSVQCTGGNSIGKQIGLIRRGVNFYIGTPGRLQDLYKRKVLHLEGINSLVLDEIDRMLDMGFLVPIREIVSKLPEDKHSMFFSATVNRKIEDLINTFLKPDFVKISVVKGRTAENVDQDIVTYGSASDKIAKLEEILKHDQTHKTLIFVSTKRFADRLDKDLYEKGYKVATIHGDKRQSQRTRALDLFKTARVQILIATDVAARGLDISDISHVINYDEPNTYDDYVHRIGRTGRADKKGIALTFVQR